MRWLKRDSWLRRAWRSMFAQGRDDYDGALQSFGTAAEILTAVVEQDPENTTWQRDVSNALSRIGDVAMAAPRPAQLGMAARSCGDREQGGRRGRATRRGRGGQGVFPALAEDLPGVGRFRPGKGRVAAGRNRVLSSWQSSPRTRCRIWNAPLRLGNGWDGRAPRPLRRKAVWPGCARKSQWPPFSRASEGRSGSMESRDLRNTTMEKGQKRYR